MERRFYSMSPPRAEYVLAEKGRVLGPIVGAMRNGTQVLEVTASPENLLSLLLAQLGHAAVVALCPLLEAERKTYARIELFRV
jgi:hypothetical protein